MAIDTAERRRACVSIAFGWSGGSVTPTVGKDAEWRQEAGWGYPGIAAASPVADTGFWCALTGSSGLTAGGDIEELE